MPVIRIFSTTVVFILSIAFSMQPSLGIPNEGFLVTSDYDDSFPEISPDSRFVIYTQIDGGGNPMVLVDSSGSRRKFLKTSLFEAKIKGMKFSMEGCWNTDSNSFAYVSLSPDPEILIFKVDEMRGKDLGLHESSELMPFFKGNILFASNAGGRVDVYEWSGKLRRITNSRAVEFYPVYTEKGIAFIEYDLGKTSLVIEKKKIPFEKGQLGRILPSPDGKHLLVVVNVGEYNSDLYLFSIEKTEFSKIADDVLDTGIFWLDDKVFGYVPRKDREKMILSNLKGEKRTLSPVPGYSIESVSSSKNGWIALSVFNPSNTSTDIYLYRVRK